MVEHDREREVCGNVARPAEGHQETKNNMYYLKYQGEGESDRYLVISARNITLAAQGRGKIVRRSNTLSAATKYANQLTRQGQPAFVAFRREIIGAGSH
jgi:hypothetical protein